MGVDIDWGALKPAPNAFGLLIQGQQEGQQLRDQQTKRNAFAKYSSDPQGAVSDLMAVDPESAIRLRAVNREDQADVGYQKAASQYGTGDTAGAMQTAIATRNPQLAQQLATLTKEQQAAFADHMKVLGTVAYGVKDLPYEQRKAAISAQKQMLVGRGIPEAQIDAYDPTDANLSSTISSAQDVGSLIKGAQSDRTAAETERHNKETEKYLGVRAVAPGGTIGTVNPDTPGSGPPATAPGPTTGPAPTKLTDLVTGAFPGAKITSTQRTPDQNAAVHGVAGSEHLLPDGAVDFTLGSEGEMQAAADRINKGSNGGLRAIYEGPGAANSTGPHVHVQRVAGAAPTQGAAAPASGGETGGNGFKVLFKAPEEPPEWHPDGQGNLLNSKTGDRKPDPTYTGAANANPNLVKMVLDGRYPPPTGRAATSPQWLAVLDAASAQDPNFNAADYHTRYATRTSFTSGKDADQIKSLNTAMGHAASMAASIDAMNDTPIPGINKAKNAVEGMLGQNIAAKPYALNKDGLMHEALKVFSGASGAYAEFKSIADTLDPNDNPATQKAVLQKLVGMLSSRMDALADKYTQGMGHAVNGVQFLSPKAQQAYAKVTGNPVSPEDAAPAMGGAGSSAAAATKAPIRVSTPEEAAALAPGTVFITPDGRRKIR